MRRHWENCWKCGGRGTYGRFGTCFACNGKGGRDYKQPAAVRAKARVQAADRRDRNTQENLDAFAAAYPAEWAWRRYNEQNLIKSLLPRYAVEFSSHWVVSRRPDLLQRGVLGRLPLVPGAVESSLWLRAP